ncbi:MAG: accessory gene regulator B family protein [Lachnospiraceae bacterium]|nr:accessory gene regulator B family protein [Lachnospiraceae bacterium]
MERFIEHIVTQMVSRNFIKKEDIEVYRFGLECACLKFIHILSYLLIGILLNEAISLLFSGCLLILLRKKAGGYHAKTRVGCYIFSCCIVFIMCMWNDLEKTCWLNIIVLIVADIIIFILAPIDNENRRLDSLETRDFRRQSIIMLFIINMIIILILITSFSQIGGFLISSVAMEALLMILGKVMQNFD